MTMLSASPPHLPLTITVFANNHDRLKGRLLSLILIFFLTTNNSLFLNAEAKQHPLCSNLTALGPLKGGNQKWRYQVAIGSASASLAPSSIGRTVNIGVLVDMRRQDECQRLQVIVEAVTAANGFLGRLVDRTGQLASLRFFINDTSGNGDAMMSLYSFFNNNEQRAGRPIDYILGPTQENTIKAVIEVAMFRRVPVISYAQTPPLILSANAYNSLVRIGLTRTDYHWAIAKLIRTFNWTHITLVTLTTNSTSDPSDIQIAHFEHIAKLHGISVASTVRINLMNNTMQLRDDQLKLLNNIFYRIVVAFLDGSNAIELLCQLDRPFSALHWIFVGSYPLNWLRDASSIKAMKRCPESAHKAFLSTTENIQSFVDSSFVIDISRQHSGIDPRRLSSRLFRPPACRGKSRDAQKLTREMRQAWDAVWLLASVIAQGNRWSELIKAPIDFSKLTDISTDQPIYLIPRKYQKTEDSFILRNESITNPLLIDCLSGPLIIEDGARRPVFRVYQIQNSQMFPVMLYHPIRDTLAPINCEICRDLDWRMGYPPKDSIMEYIERHTTPLWLTAIVFIATGCGAALALSFFIFTIVNRKQRIIKLSAPSLTGIFAIGSVMLYLLLPFLSHSESFFTSHWGEDTGTDQTVESESKANVTCLIRYLLLFCGFSCTFCSVALRTYKIYIATTSIPGNLRKQLFVRDERLILVLGFIVALDVILVVTWSQVVGFDFHEQNETKYYDPEMDQLITYQSIECSTPHSGLFFAVCFSWKLLIIAFGLFLAWRIHGVKIKVLNDAKFIGAISYIIVISALVVIVIHMVNLSHSGVAIYLLDVSIVISANTLCLLLNFLPKVIAVHRGESAVLCSDQFVEQGGTRRFNTDYGSEHANLRTVEMQNTLLKQELIKLTVRVERLEKVLQERFTIEPSESMPILQSLSPRNLESFSKLKANWRSLEGHRASVPNIVRAARHCSGSANNVASSHKERTFTRRRNNSPREEKKSPLKQQTPGQTACSLQQLSPPMVTLVAPVCPPSINVTTIEQDEMMEEQMLADLMAESVLERELNELDVELRRALGYSLKSLAEI